MLYLIWLSPRQYYPFDFNLLLTFLLIYCASLWIRYLKLCYNNRLAKRFNFVRKQNLAPLPGRPKSILKVWSFFFLLLFYLNVTNFDSYFYTITCFTSQTNNQKIWRWISMIKTKFFCFEKTFLLWRTMMTKSYKLSKIDNISIQVIQEW